jgi:hypothetical protein
MSDPKEPDLDLDALFADARAEAVPTDALIDRIVADAAVVNAPVVVPGPGLWERMLDAVGGWPSISGLATAAIAGVYIGFSDPTLLETVGLTDTTDVTSDLLFGDEIYFDDASIGEG